MPNSEHFADSQETSSIISHATTHIQFATEFMRSTNLNFLQKDMIFIQGFLNIRTVKKMRAPIWPALNSASGNQIDCCYPCFKSLNCSAPLDHGHFSSEFWGTHKIYCDLLCLICCESWILTMNMLLSSISVAQNKMKLQTHKMVVILLLVLLLLSIWFKWASSLKSGTRGQSR